VPSVNSVLQISEVSPGVVLPDQPVVEKLAVALTVDGGNNNVLGLASVVVWVSVAAPATQGPLAAYAGAATEVTSTGAAQAAFLASVRRVTPGISGDAPSSRRACQPFMMTPQAHRLR
jgi:hypothetical protein